MTIDAGRKPEYLRLRLIPGSDFLLELAAEGGDSFVEDPSFVFPGTTTEPWVGVLDDDRLIASWQIPAVEVDALIAASGTRRARLLYGSLVWAEGKFEVDRD